MVKRRYGPPERRNFFVTAHLLCESRRRGLAVRVDNSRRGHPAVKHPSGRGQPLGVPARDDDFDGAAGNQQRSPQPGVLPAPRPQGALRLLLRQG